MIVEQIIPGIFIFKNFLSEEKYKRLYDLLGEINYLNFYKRNIINNNIYNKNDLDEFKFDVLYLGDNIKIKEEIFVLINEEINYIKKFGEKIYNERLSLNNMGGIIKIKKGDSMGIHNDTQSTIQGVIYLQDGDKNNEEGGNLSIFIKNKEYLISPEKNSVIIFRGGLYHAVRPYNGEQIRYSIPFGFDNEENKLRNKELNYFSLSDIDDGWKK